jgi:hypothetical protein
MAYEELGRGEGQAYVLMSIIQALEEAKQEGDLQQNQRALYLARIARLLEGMNRPSLPPGEDAKKGA